MYVEVGRVGSYLVDINLEEHFSERVKGRLDEKENNTYTSYHYTAT